MTELKGYTQLVTLEEFQCIYANIDYSDFSRYFFGIEHILHLAIMQILISVILLEFPNIEQHILLCKYITVYICLPKCFGLIITQVQFKYSVLFS